MEKLLCECRAVLACVSPADLSDPSLQDRLLLRDMLLTAIPVLDAMLYSAHHSEPGVLETDFDGSRRVPPRSADRRDLWFERVWKESLKNN